MDDASRPAFGRRHFLGASVLAGAALVIPVRLLAQPHSTLGETRFAPNAWVTVLADGSVEITMAHIEMGQGAQTGLAMLVAEELDVAMDAVRLRQAPADEERYGPQITGGSQSIRSGWLPMRHAGATARAMLVAAAAARWTVKPESCSTADGVVRHDATGRSVSFAALIPDAAKLPVPSDVPLKKPADFKLIGRASPRVEGIAKVRGEAVFGIDAAVPGARIATLIQSPVFGGKLVELDDVAAKASPGVSQIVRLDDAVAIVADTMPHARQAVALLKPQWDNGPSAEINSAAIRTSLLAALEAPGVVASSVGTPGAVPGRRIEATYEQPFLAHAPMEPMNCTVQVTNERCEIWTGTQVATTARAAVAKQLGLPVTSVMLNVYLMGGGFGRRLEIDGVLRAVQIGRQVEGPVQVIWSREEDMQHDMYRPAYADRIEAVLDDHGRPVDWMHRIAGSSIIARLYPEAFKGVDSDAVECAAKPLYDLPNLKVEFQRVESGVPTSWWRGVGATRSLFVVESFIDELAFAAKVNPIAYRRAMLSDKRVLGVLDRLETMMTAPANRTSVGAWGVSLFHAFGSYCALAVHVSREQGGVRVRKVLAALDCGRAINPDMVSAQIEGGCIFGAGAALSGEITLANGAVEQSNFADFPMMTMATAPHVDVEIIASEADPGGVGEVGTAGIAPAITNAIFALDGTRIRRLPVSSTMPVWSA